MTSLDDLRDKPWWHGYVPHDEACRLIEQQGDFLVRASSPGTTTEIILTACDNRNKPVHAALRFDIVWFFPAKEGGKQLSFPTVSDLIDHYIDHPTKNVPLTRPIPRLEPELRLENIYYEGVHCMGKGAYATTFWGSLTRPFHGDNKSIAVKIPTVPEGDKAVNMAARRVQLLEESAKLLYCLHPNVARFLGIAFDATYLLIVSEHVPGKSLHRHLSKFGVLTDNREKLLYLLEVAAGVNYLHNKGIVHRAIAARNCFVTVTGKIVVGDYGVNALIDAGYGERHSCWCRQGPPLRWLAPETLGSSTAFSKASDCWALGILAYEIFANSEQPWPGMTDLQMECEIRKGTGPAMPATTPDRVVVLLKRIWDATPQRRIAIKQIGKEIINMIEDTIRLIGEFPADLLTLNRIPQVTRAVYYEPTAYDFTVENVLTASQWTNNRYKDDWCDLGSMMQMSIRVSNSCISGSSCSSSDSSLPPVFGSTLINVKEGSTTRSSSATSLAPAAPVSPAPVSTYVDSNFKENSSVYVATPTGRGSGGSNQSKSSTGSGMSTYSTKPSKRRDRNSKKFYGEWN